MVEADDKYAEVIKVVEKFFEFDKDNNGVLSREELHAYMQANTSLEEEYADPDDVLGTRLRCWGKAWDFMKDVDTGKD